MAPSGTLDNAQTTKMGMIVAVHGVGQQFKGDAIIHREWWPAFLSGVHLAGCDVGDERQFVCPFYGDVFRRAGTLAASDDWQPTDIEAEEAALLEVFWRFAAEAEPAVVPSPALYAAGTSLARTPQFIQRALNALSKSSFWASVSQGMLIGDLKQVLRYLNDPDLHDHVLKRVLEAITPNTKVVIGHSLGSVIAYEALCREAGNVVSFISLGSPLGIRNLIFEKLTPHPTAMSIGVWPGRVKHWTNIADRGDIVAMQKQLAPLFGSVVKDVTVYNGSDAHHGERYLTTKEAGVAACSGLWERSS
jgi:pimeloyl-ACP methyl ester carboxylesterase